MRSKRASIGLALAAGVTIANGSDVGVFTHGDNARELEILVEYGLSPSQALVAATSTAARVLGLEGEIGTIAPGAIADLLVVRGDPTTSISAIRNVQLVLQRGSIVRSALP
jgi:imidazolonepropionase-like amidohydrolase